MKLSDAQEQILSQYADQCFPRIKPELKGDLNYLMNERFIHREQNHITDKGLAYVVAELNYSFTRFLARHKWEGRLQVYLRFARLAFQTDKELDIYFKAKYKVNLKYDTWSAGGAEQQLPKEQLKMFVAEMFSDLLENPSIDWQKVMFLFKHTAEQMSESDALELYNTIRSREQAQDHFRRVMQGLEQQ